MSTVNIFKINQIQTYIFLKEKKKELNFEQ